MPSSQIHYSLVTPSLVPSHLLAQKKPNLGDGFIKRRIQDLLTPATLEYVFSTWTPLSACDIERINSTKALIIAGANPLADDYTVVRGMTSEDLRKINVPIIPFGVGITGEPGRNRKMSDMTKNILLDIHERISCSSWRCPRTLGYLLDNVPELTPKAMMTGCPVTFDRSLLSGRTFGQEHDTIAVTVTERRDFWRRETALLEFVKTHYPDARKMMVLHQKFDEPSAFHRMVSALRGNWLRTPGELRRFAEKAGFEIHAPNTVDECWQLYHGCDIHIGSRLHAHLYFLSQAKQSYLVRVDGRADGFAEALGFELFNPRHGALPAQDLEAYRAAARRLFDNMKAFVFATKRLLGTV